MYNWNEWAVWAIEQNRPSLKLRSMRDGRELNRYHALKNLIDTPQHMNHHPEGDVWEHTMQTIDVAAIWASEVELTTIERMTLIFTMLCHDMGKPSTTILKSGRKPGMYSAPGHAKAGVPVAKAFLADLGAPEILVNPILKLVRYHMIHVNLTSASKKSAVQRAVNKMYRNGVDLDMLSYVSMCDYGGRVPLDRPFPPSIETIASPPKGMMILLNERDSMLFEGEPVKAIITGKWLIEAGVDSERAVKHRLVIDGRKTNAFAHMLSLAKRAQTSGRITDNLSAQLWFYKAVETGLFGFDPFNL